VVSKTRFSAYSHEEKLGTLESEPRRGYASSTRREIIHSPDFFLEDFKTVLFLWGVTPSYRDQALFVATGL